MDGVQGRYTGVVDSYYPGLGLASTEFSAPVIKCVLVWIWDYISYKIFRHDLILLSIILLCKTNNSLVNNKSPWLLLFRGWILFVYILCSVTVAPCAVDSSQVHCTSVPRLSPSSPAWLQGKSQHHQVHSQLPCNRTSSKHNINKLNYCQIIINSSQKHVQFSTRCMWCQV